LKLCDYLPPTIRHTLASRFEMQRLPRWMAWKGGNISSDGSGRE
jgi:hypothetical protein